MMMIRLEDGRRPHEGHARKRLKVGSHQKKVIYNPNTGMAVVFHQPMQDADNFLLSKGPLKKLKAKINAKQEFHTAKKAAKRAGKLERVQQHQESKTQRQHTRQDARQAHNEAIRVRQQNKVDRRTARGQASVQNIQNKAAQRQAKDAQEQQEAAADPTYDESSDQIPNNDDINGGDYMISPEDQGGAPDTIDVDHEDVTDQDGDYDPNKGDMDGKPPVFNDGEFDFKKIVALVNKVKSGNAAKLVTSGSSVAGDLALIKKDLQVIRKAVDPNNQVELSSGWISAVLKGVKGAAGGVINAAAPDSKLGKSLLNIKDSKAGQAVNKLVNSKTGQTVKSITGVSQLQAENKMLKDQVASLQKQRYYYAAAGAGSGALLGYVLKPRR